MSFVLHLGDCLAPETGLASLADKSVDHVITDPPYSRDLYLKFRTNKGAGTISGRGSVRSRTKESTSHLALANMAIGAVDDVWEKCGPHLLRSARRWIVIFHDVESGHMWRTAMGDSYIRAGVWVKTNAVPQISGDRPGTGIEAITIAHREGRKRWNGGGRPAVWECCSAMSTDRSDHPCPKPTLLMEKLVRDFTDPGETILDPFAGSGTTGVAAIRLGRNFIGFERDPKYHAIALKRLQAAREQMEMFGDVTAGGATGARGAR